MKIDVLLGLQWGDEGKGKVVDVLTPRYDVVARFRAARMPVIRSNLRDISMCSALFPRAFSSMDKSTL